MEYKLKKTIIGCTLSIVGALGYLSVTIFVGNNLVSGWGTPPGRFLTTVGETEMAVPLIVSLMILLTGMWIMAVEYARKGN